MICLIVLRISRTLICSKRLYGLLRHGKNQLEEGCVVRRQFVKVIDFLEGERSRFPGKRTAGNDGEGRMGNDHLSRRSSPTASPSFQSRSDSARWRVLVYRPKGSAGEGCVSFAGQLPQVHRKAVGKMRGWALRCASLCFGASE